MGFDTIEQAQKYVHRNCDNILVEDVNPDGDECYIFFSSNGITGSEPVDKYVDSLIYKNRFEWRSIADTIKGHRQVGRIIYVRDPYMRFYIHGVSEEINNIENTLSELNRLTSDKAWRIITMGISSGGYMSMIAGMALSADRIFNISGQYDLSVRIPEYYDDFIRINPGYGRIIDKIREYNDRIDRKADIWYFCPIGCEHDREQLEAVKDISCIKTFVFPDKIHAATVYPFNFPDLLIANKRKINKLYEKYSGREINKNHFLIDSMTVRGWISFSKRAIRSKLRISAMKNAWDVKND